MFPLLFHIQQHHLGKFCQFIIYSNISLRPDEVALAWRSVKACQVEINWITLFQHLAVLSNMDTNKDSNLFGYLKNKYGEECVRLLRNWEFTIKKMADYRNHRKFTLRCIKASLTPVSCKLKNPLKTNKSYNIIHKAEKQLLHERIRNINSILYMYEHNRHKQYSCLRNMITKNETNSCLHLIKGIKEHRHDKIKARQINKFEHSYFKKHGYYHNFTRGLENFNNISQATLSGHSHLLPSSSSTISNASGNSTTPAAPMAPTPSVTTSLAPTVGTQPHFHQT